MTALEWPETDDEEPELAPTPRQEPRLSDLEAMLVRARDTRQARIEWLMAPEAPELQSLLDLLERAGVARAPQSAGEPTPTCSSPSAAAADTARPWPTARAARCGRSASPQPSSSESAGRRVYGAGRRGGIARAYGVGWREGRPVVAWPIVVDHNATEDTGAAPRDNPTEPHDPILAGLTHLLNRLGQVEGAVASIGVMLMIGGSLYAADIVSARGWWEETSQNMRGATTGGLDEVAAMVSDVLANQFETVSQFYRDQGPGSDDRMAYVHLRNVRVLGQMNIVDGLTMRVRLSEIQGWTMGRPS